MIKLIVFNDGNVTFDYNENGLKELTEEQRYIESIFGTVSDSEAIDLVITKYPEMSKEQIISELATIFNRAYKEIIPSFLANMREINTDVKIAIATEHTAYIDRYLSNYVTDYYISNAIGYSKSNPLFYQYIINKSGIDPRDILYVDYDESNINMARSVGISTRQVTENDLNLKEDVQYTQLGHRLIDVLNQVKKTK